MEEELASIKAKIEEERIEYEKWLQEEQKLIEEAKLKMEE